MGQQGDHLDTGAAQTAEEILQTVTQDLKTLHQGLVAQMAQDITQLQGEKARLNADVAQLQANYQGLQSPEGLSLEPSPSQQWARQLSQGLASQLQALLVQRLNQVASGGHSNTPPLLYANGDSENAHRLLASLDITFSTAFHYLQQELRDSHSLLSQQLSRSPNLEQQGAVILEALIQCLRDQLQAETGDRSLMGKSDRAPEPPPEAKPIPLEIPAAPLSIPAQPQKPASEFKIGLLLVLLSTAALSFHNVVVRIIGTQSNVLGLFAIGGFIKLSPGNSLLILWLRMLVVLPLMIPVSMFFYPDVWRDLKKLLTGSDRRSLYIVSGSGVFLFMSQIFTYIAIGKIGPSVAVTILFMYPLITVPLAWLLFRDRPTPLRWLVMGIISLGVILAALPSIQRSSVAFGDGVLVAIGAGIAFALYLIFMQLGFRKLHPVPVSLIQFSTIFVLSSLILLLPLDLEVQVAQPSGFVFGSILLGVLTLVGYLANNFGVRFMGAARASIIASSGPVVTALLAFLLIQTPLQVIQIVGILLVTGGVTALSFERMKAQPAKPAK